MEPRRRRAGRRAVGVAAVLLPGVLLTACGAGTDEGGAAPGGAAPGEVVVFAATTLGDALEELADVFAAEGGARVLLNLAGSQTLAAQVVAGAPADLLITADAVQMDVVANAGLVSGEPTVVATNALTIVVEAGNPRGVTGLVDLARGDLIVVLPAEEVPAGRYAREVLARAGVRVSPASLEQSVRAALGKVAQGEADAAIVFVSDVTAALRSGARIEGVAIPAAENVVAVHPMALVRGGAAPDAARAFAELLVSERGRAVLDAYGFGAP